MWLIATLLLVSAAAGLVIGPRYNVYMLVLASPVMALVSAAATRLNDFTFWGGSITTFACVTTMQLAYLLITWLHVDLVPSPGEPPPDRIGALDERLRDIFKGVTRRLPQNDEELNHWLASPEGKAATAFEPAAASRWARQVGPSSSRRRRICSCLPFFMRRPGGGGRAP
jgi:hypothetical protein